MKLTFGRVRRLILVGILLLSPFVVYAAREGMGFGFVCNPVFHPSGLCQLPRAGIYQVPETIFNVSNYSDFRLVMVKALVDGLESFVVEISPPISAAEFADWNREIFGSGGLYDVGYVQRNYPWALWNSVSYSYSYSWLGVYRVEYNISYYCSSSEKRNVAVREAAIVRSLIDVDDDVVSRERKIHDWIATNVTYDRESFGGYDQTDCEAVFDGKAVCNGYSVLAARMLNMAGIDTLFVAGLAEGEPHAWNMVKLGSDWFHLDVTFDDPVCGLQTCGPTYDYFNLNDYEISFDHNWDKSFYPSSTGYFYERSYRGLGVHACSILEPELCRSEIECLKISGVWRDGVCYPPDEMDAEGCTYEHRFLCRDEASCEAVGAVWYDGVCMLPETARYFCESSGGTWDGSRCLEEESPSHVPTEPYIGLADPDTSPVKVSNGRLYLRFNYDGYVDIILAVFDCSLLRVWWLGDDCSFSVRFSVLGSRVKRVNCDNVPLPVRSGYVVWLVSGVPLYQLDWETDPYELLFYGFGGCW